MDKIKPHIEDLIAEKVLRWNLLQRDARGTLEQEILNFCPEVMAGLKKRVPSKRLANLYTLKLLEGIVRRSNSHPAQQIRSTFDRLGSRYRAGEYTLYEMHKNTRS